MALKISLIFVLIFFSGIYCAKPSENPVTNQEIRDAILSLIHSYSLLDNKLDRHEQRERNLGELVKKGLMTLQKNQRIFEPIKGSFERMEKRISEIETFLIDQNDKATGQQLKLIETLEEIMKLIDTSNVGSNAIDEDGFFKKLDEMNENIVNLKKDILTNQNTKADNTKELIDRTEKMVSKKQTELESFFTKMDEKLSQFYLTESPKNSDFEEKVTSTVQNIKVNVDQLKTLYEQNTGKSGSGFSEGDRKFIQQINNDTLKHLEEIKTDILSSTDKNFIKTSKDVKQVEDSVKKSVESVGMLSADTQKIVLDTSNNVLETKRRFEYGIHQIVLEVGEAVKERSLELNTTIVGLSSKIETEMSQIWRQIGIMYQEISSSKQALDRIQLTNNETLGTMDSMEGKVSLITGRMQEVDSNLNYLLGRLSLVTQEFNQIKYGLGEALDNIKQSFMTVQEKVKDIGPGPHKIAEENEDNGNSLSKRNARSSFILNLTPKRN